MPQSITGMPGIEGAADTDRRSQKFGAKAVLDPADLAQLWL